MSAGSTPNSFLFSSTLFFTPIMHYFRALFFVPIARMQVAVEQNSKITVKHEIMILMFTKKLAWRVC